MVKFVTVATHSERYFPILQESAKKFNFKFDLLGWGKEYSGHYMKDDLMIDYLKNQNPQELIIFIDGFDSVILAPPSEFKKKYKNLIKSNSTNHPILVSRDFDPCPSNIVKGIYYRNVFGKCDGIYTNSGLFMGPADQLLKFLQTTKTYRDPEINSNQIIWQKYYNDFRTKNPELPPVFQIDKNSEIFLNFGEMNSISQLDLKVKISKRSKRVHLGITQTLPCVISGPGTSDLDKIIKKLGYQLTSPQNTIDKYLGYFKKIPYYIKFFYPHIIYGLIFFVLIILIIYFWFFR